MPSQVQECLVTAESSIRVRLCSYLQHKLLDLISSRGIVDAQMGRELERLVHCGEGIMYVYMQDIPVRICRTCWVFATRQKSKLV